MSLDELKTVSLTMVAAGLDTLPGNINMTIAYLSSAHGQEIQDRAYSEIMNAYEGEDAWTACLEEEKCEWMQSFVKEVLRYWSTLNMSFTRESIKDIEYKGATIPAHTPFFMVSLLTLYIEINIDRIYRTCGPPTTTQPTSKPQWTLCPSGSSVYPTLAEARSISHTAQALAHALGTTSPIANCMPSSRV